jgi:formylglycine-generating enzyme required for sulfatase activity
METTPWRDADNADNADKELVQSNPAYPAVYISWHDAQELIQRLNSAAGKEVYRLPTEAEWEYACRAGTSTLWSFGNDEGEFPHYAWYRENTVDRNEKYAHAVGQHRPNAWGLHDMHGNVWEWVQDWFAPDYYKRSPRMDPLGPTSGSDRVMRGGDFSDPVMNYRSGSRMAGAPDTREWYVGVRLVKVR